MHNLISCSIVDTAAALPFGKVIDPRSYTKEHEEKHSWVFLTLDS